LFRNYEDRGDQFRKAVQEALQKFRSKGGDFTLKSFLL
jgi:hypothetical protein